MGEGAMFPLQVRGLRVRLGAHEALAGIDLDVRAGARVVVLGANGAGKSVLLRALHGLLAPSGGTILWGGSPGRPRAQAMVFQRPVMLRRSALANVTYALAANRVDGPRREARALEAMRRVGLAHLAARHARSLSVGEQQRLALARAWALEPRMLFLDEPTASLDPAAAAEVERVVGDIHAAGTAVVTTTHNLGFARRFGGEIVFLHAGRIAERTDAETFFRAPASDEARRFLQGELPWTIAPPVSAQA